MAEFQLSKLEFEMENSHYIYLPKLSEMESFLFTSESINENVETSKTKQAADAIFYKVPLKYVPVLVAGLKVFTNQGFAYVAMTQVVSLAATLFHSQLSKALILTNRIRFLWNTDRRITFGSFFSSSSPHTLSSSSLLWWLIFIFFHFTMAGKSIDRSSNFWLSDPTSDSLKDLEVGSCYKILSRVENSNVSSSIGTSRKVSVKEIYFLGDVPKAAFPDDIGRVVNFLTGSDHNKNIVK
ncbi:putative DNA primase large subunit [Senna tora]|uniref:Putative DNA primase large subunit n=1 Tax=Senna tora TaxID=362788 RepID=A0A834U4U2_9FABA|nr:putative DNA primase large subunit [Senna tora]